MADQRIVCPHCEQFSLVIPPGYQCEYCRKPLKQGSENRQELAPIFSKSEEIPVVNSAQDSGFQEVTRIENQLVDKEGQTALAWLIVHTENRAPAYYEIYQGSNVFGRQDDGYEVDIEIQEDTYVSRSHGHIWVEQDILARWRFTLWDDGSHRIGGKCSTNGTYINGIKQRIQEKQSVFLEDGDTIQIGETKLVFKHISEQQANIQVVATEVISSAYTQTVVFN